MRLKIYTVENQEIFTAVYRSVFTAENGFKLLGTARVPISSMSGRRVAKASFRGL